MHSEQTLTLNRRRQQELKRDEDEVGCSLVLGPIQWGVYLHVVMGIFTTMPSLVLSSCLGTHHLSFPFFFPFGQLAPACTDVIEHMDVCSRACVCATAGGSYSSHRLCEHFLSQIKITIIEGLTMMCVCALGVRQLRRSGDTRDLIFLKRERKELEDQERTLSDRWVSVCLLKRKGNFFQRKELADERARLE